MKNYEKIIAEAIRIEYSEKEDKLYIVFEVIDPISKINIKKNWADDIEYHLIDRKLMEK